MTLHFPIASRAILGGVLAVLCAAPAVHAQQSTSREVVQPLPSQETQRLNRALLELARSPSSVTAMLEAGDASLDVGDLDAAIGFYGRAAEVDPSDARIKLGLARVYLRSGRPVEAMPLLEEAQAAGAAPTDILGARALAFDLLGDQASAQSAYNSAIELAPQDDEARRRLGISQAISGDAASFQATLSPLIEARDIAAFRARAFGLAILGEQERAEGIVNSVMPPDIAARINPYLAYMPRLTPAQQAAAANLGIFPRAADIGREDPRIARFANAATSGSKLEPAGEPLGAPAPDTEPEPVRDVVSAAPPTSSQPTPVPAPAPEAARLVAGPVQGTDAMAQPTPVLEAAAAEGRSLPQVATSEIVGPSDEPQLSRQELEALAAERTPTPTPAQLAFRPVEEVMAEVNSQSSSSPTVQDVPASVADAFADLGEADLPSGRSSAEAVDLAAIEVPREAQPAPQTLAQPEEPANPPRIWVQLATGRDVKALAYDWRRFNRRAPELLGEFEPYVTPWGQANRLLAGPLENAAAARRLVNELGKKGLDTFIYRSSEGTEIKELK